MTSKDTNEIDKPVSEKINKKISLRCGDPNDNQIQGNILFEQTFSST